jgi:hypothetical protein
MSMLFNHGFRHGICGTNPIRLVRQGAKRETIPIVLTSDEVRSLMATLPLRERTLVLLAAGTRLAPQPSCMETIKGSIRDVWKQRQGDVEDMRLILNRKLEKAERERRRW